MSPLKGSCFDCISEAKTYRYQFGGATAGGWLMIRSTLMNGQWIGRYGGTNSGQLVVDLDDRGTHYEGIACAYDDDQLLPGTFVHVKTADKQTTFQDRLPLFPIDPRTGEPNDWANLQALFPQGVKCRNMPPFP